MPGQDPKSRYVLGEEIARGGLGRVVEAFDTELKRPVAVKLILEDLTGDARERFIREAELTARLEHPNIVPVHGLLGAADAGAALLLAMKRVHGRDLASLISAFRKGDEEATRAWSRPRLLAMFQQVCLGVAFAHDRGVIHRDLKPSNIMLGNYGETLIVDWGLAREKGSAVGARDPAQKVHLPGTVDRTFVPVRSGAPSSLTMDGDILGTPAYMPPEQAEGRQADVDERSDVYALGAILYEMLTLQPPVEGDSIQELLMKTVNGTIQAPSLRPNPARPVAAIPAELDTIVMKALALRRDDRYPTARAFHDDIQLFLEGVKEREHRQRAARERVEAGKRMFGRYQDLRKVIEEQVREVKDLFERIKPYQTPAEKRPLWEAEALLRATRDERIDVFSRASAEFGQALTVDPENAEALDGKCELYFDRFLEAERKRDREEMLLNRRTLEQFDRDGRFAAKLDAPGVLTLRTWAYGCDCLKPVRDPAWRVEIGLVPDTPWRRGGPRHGEAVTERDRPVPTVRTFPAGAARGHAPDCPRRGLEGVEISIAKYEEKDKRLVLGPERRLGASPVTSVPLEQGSYRCTLRPADPTYPEVRLPVLIERAGKWSQDVTLYRRDEYPPGFGLVPGGPFTFGGSWAGGGDAQQLSTRDFFLADFAVTCREYLEYLHDLCGKGRVEEARRRQPREADRRWWTERDGRFTLPPPEEDPRVPWDPRCPVFSIDWNDAIAYAEWRSLRDGLAYRLMHEEEYEKAARGVDGRVFSYGDAHDASYSHINHSFPGGVRLKPVGTFPEDESPCGARDLSGCISTWCWNAPEPPWREWRAVRGGGWSVTATGARSGYRRIEAPSHLAWYYGIRLVVPAMRESL